MTKKNKIIISIIIIFVGIFLSLFLINNIISSLKINDIVSNSLIDIQTIPKLNISNIIFIILSLTPVVIPSLLLILSKFYSKNINIFKLIILSIILILIITIIVIYYINNNILL